MNIDSPAVSEKFIPAFILSSPRNSSRVPGEGEEQRLPELCSARYGRAEASALLQPFRAGIIRRPDNLSAGAFFAGDSYDTLTAGKPVTAQEHHSGHHCIILPSSFFRLSALSTGRSGEEPSGRQIER